MRQEFPKSVKLAAWKRCGGICECGCNQKIIGGMVEYDHILEDYLGGQPTLENCRVMRTKCHDAKTAERRPEIDKTRRTIEKNAGIRKPKGRPLPGTKASGLRKKMDGSVERR